jgi:predicted LPLAT superfamily acyltransferase
MSKPDAVPSAQEAIQRVREASQRRPLWKRVPEHGASWGILSMVWICRIFGRRVAGWALWFVSVYYALFAWRARRASREFLRRAGLDGSFAQVLRHIWTFARVALDRMLFVTGKFEDFDVQLYGHEHVMRACGKFDSTALEQETSKQQVAEQVGTERSAETTAGEPAAPRDALPSRQASSAPSVDAKPRRGAILLGAHLGSFEAMRAAAEKYDVPLWIVADFSNAERINGMLELLAPNLMMRAIGVDPSNPSSMIQIKEVLERGELVAILADRNTERRDRSVAVPFFGQKAYFPAGPYVLAHVLGCPVLLVYGLFSAPNRYDLYCEPFESRISLPRRTRGEAIEALASRYADRLEARARMAPYNWFNFYDFWEE